MLCVLDGWGHREDETENAITPVNTPNFQRMWAENPHALIDTCGIDVGLPQGQMGNSEVGHMNLGAGRIVNQDIRRIDAAIEDASIEWSASESPFIPVARIVFSAQDFASEEQANTCQHLSFTPWHALPAHRPLGSLNRARKTAYSSISSVRHGLNGVPRVEPTE